MIVRDSWRLITYPNSPLPKAENNVTVNGKTDHESRPWSTKKNQNKFNFKRKNKRENTLYKQLLLQSSKKNKSMENIV